MRGKLMFYSTYYFKKGWMCSYHGNTTTRVVTMVTLQHVYFNKGWMWPNKGWMRLNVRKCFMCGYKDYIIYVLILRAKIFQCKDEN